MKRLLGFAFTLWGATTLLMAGIIAFLSIQPAPPFYVAYVERDDDGEQVVYIARTDGEDVWAVQQNGWSPIWSPDGSRLALFSEHNLRSQLKVVESEQGARSIILVWDWFMHTPSWAPDSEWIAFSAFDDDRHSIFRVNVDDRRVQQMTDGSGNDFHPTWSPDGQWLAFASNRNGQDGNDIYRILVDGPANSLPERLTFVPHSAKRSLKWSPDGDQIAFIARDSLYMLHVDTGQLGEMTEVLGPDMDWQLSWSGDGEWLYILKERNGEPIWHRIQANGENLMSMPEVGSASTHAWSPDEERSRLGTYIVLTVSSLLLFLNVLSACRRILDPNGTKLRKLSRWHTMELRRQIMVQGLRKRPRAAHKP